MLTGIESMLPSDPFHLDGLEADHNLQSYTEPTLVSSEPGRGLTLSHTLDRQRRYLHPG